MALINTEDAAKRLARVILSDIELYSRERPKGGETLEGQIEEGRKLFVSRVAPELLPLFSVVVADRAAARGAANVEAVAASSPEGATATNGAVGGEATPRPAAPLRAEHRTPAPASEGRTFPKQTPHTPPVAARPSTGDDWTPAPAVAARPSTGDDRTPVPTVTAPPSADDDRTPVPTVAAPPSPDDDRTPAPTVAAPPSAADDRTPIPTFAEARRPEPRREPKRYGVATPPAGVSVLAAAPSRSAAAASPLPNGQDRTPAPLAAASASEVSVPVLTRRISVLKLAALAAVAACAIAVLQHFVR